MNKTIGCIFKNLTFMQTKTCIWFFAALLFVTQSSVVEAYSGEGAAGNQVLSVNQEETDLNLKIQLLAYEEFKAIDRNEIDQVYLRALKAWVQIAQTELKKAGFADTALNLERELQNGLSAFELGDHRFISQKLNVLYDDIELKLGKKFCHFMRLDDIRIVNYGYVVTMYPKGDPKTGDTWDKLEYQKHFVPFTAAVSYWAARLAVLLAFPEAAMISGVILEIPRYAYEHWIGPGISDRVYDKALSKP